MAFEYDCETQYDAVVLKWHSSVYSDFRMYGETIPSCGTLLRPDQRALEHGDIALATSEKLRLESKQRISRKARAKAKVSSPPEE
eukprot:155768-Prorocentrum_minimum.AAC.1